MRIKYILLKRNLLNTYCASNNSGLERINKLKTSKNVGDFKSKRTNTAPKNKLPESPINIFAGAQFTKESN